MAIDAKKKEGESATSLMYRFSKKVQRSGVVREVKKRRFLSRRPNKSRRRLSAAYRDQKRSEMEKLRKLGLLKTVAAKKKKR